MRKKPGKLQGLTKHKTGYGGPDYRTGGEETEEKPDQDCHRGASTGAPRGQLWPSARTRRTEAQKKGNGAWLEIPNEKQRLVSLPDLGD